MHYAIDINDKRFDARVDRKYFSFLPSTKSHLPGFVKIRWRCLISIVSRVRSCLGGSRGPEHIPRHIYASCLPFSGSVLLPYISSRGINEDERRDGVEEKREESRTMGETGRTDEREVKVWLKKRKGEKESVAGGREKERDER